LASILGREFDFDTLVEASELDEDALIEALEGAEQDQLIEEVSSEDGVIFAFIHAMIPTTLSEGVRTLRRRRIHRRAASAIESTRPEDYEALAYHNGEAGDHEKALRYYTLAGERAAKAYANQEAETYFRSALDMVRTESERAHLCAELGEVLFNQSRFEEAIETWREGIKLYQGLEDKDRVAWLYARCGRAAWCNGDTPGGLVICQEGMAALEGAPESTGMANLLQETARAYIFNFMPDECRELCDQALKMAERVGAVDVQVDTLATKGVLRNLTTEEAMMIFKQAIELAESAGLLFHAARAHGNFAAIYAEHIGDVSSAIEHSQKAAELCRRMGNKAMEIVCASRVINGKILKGNLAEAENQLAALRDLLDATSDPGPSEFELKSVEGYLFYVRGELLEAAELAREVQRGARDAGSLQWLSNANLDLGIVLLEMSEEDEAETALLEAVELYDKASWKGGAQPRSILTMKFAQQGDFQEAHRWLNEARERETEQGSQFFETLFRLIAERRLAVAERNWPEAWEAFEEFMRMVEKSGIRWYRARALREWGEAHLTRREPGDEERAQELLLESQTEFEEMGAPIYAAQVKEILSGLA
jgi:tetratricopeptide (TPR) repeat protein